jgi:hypothetical protein
MQGKSSNTQRQARVYRVKMAKTVSEIDIEATANLTLEVLNNFMDRRTGNILGAYIKLRSVKPSHIPKEFLSKAKQLSSGSNSEKKLIGNKAMLLAHVGTIIESAIPYIKTDNVKESNDIMKVALSSAFRLFETKNASGGVITSFTINLQNGITSDIKKFLNNEAGAPKDVLRIEAYDAEKERRSQKKEPSVTFLRSVMAQSRVRDRHTTQIELEADFAMSEDVDTQHKVITHPNVSENTILSFIDNSDYESVRKAAIGSPKTPTWKLQEVVANQKEKDALRQYAEELLFEREKKSKISATLRNEDPETASK